MSQVADQELPHCLQDEFQSGKPLTALPTGVC
jgi:hypothetical protein